MQKRALTKVFHAARQDIEIFYLLSGHTPKPIFDTQIAAAVCGYGESVSYETLVNKIVGAEIDKSSRFTDWSVRPAVRPSSLHYAILRRHASARHLRTLQIKIEATKAALQWIAEEHAQLTDPAIYNIDPSDAWKRLKFGNMRPKNVSPRSSELAPMARNRSAQGRRAARAHHQG